MRRHFAPRRPVPHHPLLSSVDFECVLLLVGHRPLVVIHIVLRLYAERDGVKKIAGLSRDQVPTCRWQGDDTRLAGLHVPDPDVVGGTGGPSDRRVHRAVAEVTAAAGELHRVGQLHAVGAHQFGGGEIVE